MRRSPPGIATCAAPRLACVKPVASVHPEPGSNSSLFKLFIISSLRNPFIVVQSHTLLTVLIRRISSPILVLLVELCKSLKELLSLSFLDCGCKGKDFYFKLPNYSGTFFSKSLFHHFVPAFSLECGCKSSVIKHNLQTFSALFFKFFFKT